MESMTKYLQILLEAIDRLKTSAVDIRDQGKIIHWHLVRDREGQNQAYNYASLWQTWWTNTGWRGEKMRKDLELAGTAISVTSDLIADLEKARRNLASYKHHVIEFKVKVLSNDR
jgi:hypothetical protein